MKDRAQAYKDFASAFYGANRPGAQVSQGTLDQFWLWSMQAGLKNSYDSIKPFLKPTSLKTSRSSISQRWSCTVRTTRSCRSTIRRRSQHS